MVYFFVEKLKVKMSRQSGDVEKKRATFGMGCFWAGDSLFGATPGVLRTTVGYSGGTKYSPSYKNMQVLLNLFISKLLLSYEY